MASQGKLTEEQVGDVAQALVDGGGRADARSIAEATEIPESEVAKALNRLEEVGAARILSSGEAVAAKRVDVEKAAEEATWEHELYRVYRRARAELIKEYAETEECRRKFLLTYFGEKYQGVCGNCGSCRTGLANRKLAAEESLPFAPKSRVRHAKYGEGMVVRYNGDKVVVLFDTEGQKELVTKCVIEKGLLGKV